MKLQCVTIQMKAIEQYFHVVLFIMPYKVVLTFKFVDETLVRDNSSESYCAVFHVVLFIMLYKVALTFKLVDETLACEQGFHVARVKSDETRDRLRHTKVEELLVVHKSYGTKR